MRCHSLSVKQTTSSASWWNSKTGSYKVLTRYTDGARVCSINNKYYTGATIYIRAVNIERDGEQYGTYYQAVRSYREKGKVKQKVVHLGEHQTAEAALESWPLEIQELKRIGRPNKAEKLQDKLDRLQELTERGVIPQKPQKRGDS